MEITHRCSKSRNSPVCLSLRRGDDACGKNSFHFVHSHAYISPSMRKPSEKVVVNVSPKDWRVFHRRWEGGVGGVKVRAHRASCENGIHSTGQSKKDRVGIEASRPRTDSRSALVGNRPSKEARLARYGPATWKQVYRCEKGKTTIRHKHSDMWQLSTHFYPKKNLAWELKAVAPGTPSKQDDFKTKRWKSGLTKG